MPYIIIQHHVYSNITSACYFIFKHHKLPFFALKSQNVDKQEKTKYERLVLLYLLYENLI